MICAPLDTCEGAVVNCGHNACPATGRAASNGGDEVDAEALAKLLRRSVETARRRLARWHKAPAGTAPATELLPRPDHPGRSRYVTTRLELARYLPEVADE